MSDQGHAEYLRDDQLLNAIFDELEGAAMEAAIWTDMSKEDARKNLILEIRAIKNVREKLATLATAPTKLKRHTVGI